MINAAAMIAVAMPVCAFAQAMVFNAPLMRVRVDAEAADPLAAAKDVMEFASAPGAAGMECAVTAAVIAVAGTTTPRREKNDRNFSTARRIRCCAAFSLSPIA